MKHAPLRALRCLPRDSTGSMAGASVRKPVMVGHPGRLDDSFPSSLLPLFGGFHCIRARRWPGVDAAESATGRQRCRTVHLLAGPEAPGAATLVRLGMTTA